MDTVSKWWVNFHKLFSQEFKIIGKEFKIWIEEGLKKGRKRSTNSVCISINKSEKDKRYSIRIGQQFKTI